MKVALLSHSDTTGGAAVVTYRLMYALRSLGVDARMVVFTKSSDDELVSGFSSRALRGISFMAEAARIAIANGFSRENIFKVSPAVSGKPYHRHPWVREADVVMIGWVNQGMLTLEEIKRISGLGKPVVWTMHDMWNLTGICHHAYECRGYKNSCGNCQFLTGRTAHDLSHKVWLRKKRLYDSVPITFVAVSHWLAERCAESSLMSGRDVRVIPNAFPVDSFNVDTSINLEKLSLRKNVIIMGAARLDDPIKGLGYAIDALNYLFDNNPELVRDSQALFFGDIRDRSVFDALRFPYRYLGRVYDPSLLREFYSASTVVLSTSLYETLPGTVIEGMSAGCVPVTFGRGGQTDIYTHLSSGYMARYRDPEDVARGIEWAIGAGVDRRSQHEEVRRRFSFSKVAQEYVVLFRELLADRGKFAKNV